MEKKEIRINNVEMHAYDYRGMLKDFRILNTLHLEKTKPSYIPQIDEDFFKSQGFALPVINITEKETHYCHTEKFNERISPLVLELIKIIQ